MPENGSAKCLVARAGVALLVTVFAGRAAPMQAADVPRPVSPGDLSETVIHEDRCPTFSWAGVDGARGYELAVLRLLDDPDAEPILVTRVFVPGDARGWTPPLDQCFERGGRFAWSVAAATAEGEAELVWGPSLHFEIAARTPLDRLLRERLDGGDAGDHGELPGLAEIVELERAVTLLRRAVEDRTESRRRRVQSVAEVPAEATRTASASTTPVPAAASLTVSQQIHLADTSAVFKDGTVFLWDDDSSGNTALGRGALTMISGVAGSNTAVGRLALHNTGEGRTTIEASNNTAVGDRALTSNSIGSRNTAVGSSALAANVVGYANTAIGFGALRSSEGDANTAIGNGSLGLNTTGDGNVAVGSSALFSNSSGYENTAAGIGTLRATTTGFRNAAIGSYALRQNTIGHNNIAIGHSAGSNNTTGWGNIFIGHRGVMGSGHLSGRIRIGSEELYARTVAAYIGGIFGRTPGSNAATVLVGADGRLGTQVSSRRFKQDIHDLGPLADRLLELRPVAFRYRERAAADPGSPLEFGLIAEEVAEVLPDLVVYDDGGRPLSVRYHLLSSLLLAELQRLSDRVADLDARSGVAGRRGAGSRRARARP